MTPRQLRTHLVMNHRRADIQIQWAQPKAMSMNEKDLLQAARCALSCVPSCPFEISDGHDPRLKCAGIQDGMASPLRYKGEWSSPKPWPPFNQGIWRKGL